MEILPAYCEDAIAKLVAFMRDVTPEQRIAVFDALRDAFCDACGDEHGAYACTCRRDE